MYPPSPYVSPADLYLFAAVLGLLCLALAYGLRQLRGALRDQTGTIQRWRDRAEKAEGESRRLRTGQQHAIYAATEAERQRRRQAEDRAGELSRLHSTAQLANQQLAQRIRELERDLSAARYKRGEDVRRLLHLVPDEARHA